VNRSTLNRWIKAGKVALPTPRKRARTTNHEPSALPALPTCSAAEWARGIREKYDLSPTDLLVLLMAEHMAVVALDNTAKFAHRQAAAGRWQRLSLQLDLEEETENDGEAEGPSTRGTVRSWPRRVG
jgi:hypothetical protein